MIYIILFILLMLCHVVSQLDFFSKKRVLKNIISIWAPISIIVLISTLKNDSVGTDSISYHSTYDLALAADNPFSLSVFDNFEIGFRMVFLSFAKFKIPFKIFQLFIYSIIYILFGFILQKESKYPSLSIIIFCLWSFLIFNFSGLRQGLSDMISLLSLFVITRSFDKLWKNIIKVLVAFLIFVVSVSIHTSAAIFALAFILYFVQKMVPESFKKIISVMAAIIPFIFLFAAQLYQVFFYPLELNRYIPTQRSGVGELFLLYFAILIVGIVFYDQNKISVFLNNQFDKLTKEKKETEESEKGMCTEKNSDSFTLLLISVFAIGVIVQSFASVCFTMTRLGNPFLLTAVIFIPNVISNNKSKNLRISAQAVIVITLLLVFYVDYYKGNYLNGFPFSF